MSKKQILTLIETVLSHSSKEQINLGSESARKTIAAAILKELSSRYHMTEYRTQDSFE